ncbi:MAG: permease-like cell division protein FtsX [Clostridia bacterium]|nr:permease-like cell division protein FtsX [Clostridia bacterium]
MNKSRYYTKTAFMGIVNNRLMSISSILTIGCCLFLFSVFLLFTLNINFIGEQIKSQCEIQAYIDMEIDGDEALAIQTEIDAIPNVKDTVFESKEKAFENYSEQLGGNSVALEGLASEDFLRNSVKITLVDLTLAQETAEQVAEVEGVAEVMNHQDTVDNVLNATTYIQSASFIIMLILMVVSLFIISNTIKLSVASRASEIHIMKFVGATNWFIRWPFIIEGVLIGLLGSLLALLVTYLGYIPLYKSVTDAFSLLKLCSPASVSGLLIPLVIAFGCFMGALASTVSTTRHLKV